MGAFKQFLSTDVTVVPFVVNKSFYFEGSASLAEAGIKQYIGNNTPYLDPSELHYIQLYHFAPSLVYNSIKQLYYTNYIPTPSQSQAPSPIYNNNGVLLSDYSSSATNARFYNYEQTTLFQTGSGSYSSQYGYSRYFPTGSGNIISVLSIPKDLFGDYINPNAFYLRYYDLNIPDYVEITDNGNGILQSSNGINGIITYPHGLISFEQDWDDEANWIEGTAEVTCSFQSSRTIYETQYKCTIRPDEFNYSLNPSLLSGSLISGSTDGTPYDFATGSYFSPYVTTIGLYNENQELLAVAKLGQPLPTSRTTDTTIIINLDR
jgi:hypothetical protein